MAWFCQGLALPAPLNPADVEELFARAVWRPEILGAAADSLRFDFALDAKDVPARFSAAVDEQIQADDAQALRVIHGLTPLQSAVLRVLAARKGDYAPFEDATIAAYHAVLRAISPDEPLKPDVSNVQQALVALQEKSMVWKEKRGVYALEESATAELLEEHGLLDAVPETSKRR